MADVASYQVDVNASITGATTVTAQLGKLGDELAGVARAATKFEQDMAAANKAAQAAAKAAAKAAAEKVRAQQQAAQQLGESLEKTAGLVGRFGGQLGGAAAQGLGAAKSFVEASKAIGGVAAGSLAAVAAVALLAGGIAYAVTQTAAWAVSLANTARDAGLFIEAVERSSDRLAGLGDALPAITRETGLANDQLIGLAKQLDSAGVSAAEMPDALRAVAVAEAALGKGAAGDFIARLKAGKTSVADLSREIDGKFGGIVARRMLGLDQQSATLKRNIGGIFGGLQIDGFLEGLSTIVGLFDSTTESGQAIKFLFESIFQPLIDGATGAFPLIEAFILGVEIQALQLYIAFKTVYNSIRDFLGIVPDAESSFDWLEIAETAGKLLIGTIVGITVVLGVLAAAVAAPVAAFVGLFALVSRAVTLGADIAAGIASGITEGAAKVIAAITGVAQGAINAAKRALGIASPSKVFAELGVQTAAGFEGGVEKESGSVSSALESMMAPPDLKSGSTSNRTSITSGGNSLTVQFNAPIERGDADWIVEKIREAYTLMIEGDAQQLGMLTPEGAPA